MVNLNKKSQYSTSKLNLYIQSQKQISEFDLNNQSQ